MSNNTKNPAAVALGRLGGSVKCPKGFAASPQAQAKAQATRKANRVKRLNTNTQPTGGKWHE